MGHVVGSAIANGRIRSMDMAAAKARGHVATSATDIGWSDRRIR
jgi:hypothetical protein